MVPHLLFLAALAQTSPTAPEQTDSQPTAVVLTTEESAMVRSAVDFYVAALNRQLLEAKKFGEDTSSQESKLRGFSLLTRAIAAKTYPSTPPTSSPELRKWVYLHVQAISAVENLVAQSRKAKKKAQVNDAEELVRRMGQQYDFAVEGQPEGTLKAWGYFDKKFTPNFKGEPVVLDEWFTELAPMTFTPRAMSPAGPLQVQIDLAPGELITGERRVMVELKSANLPTKVELLVDGELRATSEARPFQFKIEALDEREGDLNLTFVGYDEQGTRVEFPIKVKIATGSEKGAEDNVKKAHEALSNQDYARAERLARVALRADGENAEAKLIAASAAFRRGRLDIAEKYALDVEKVQPENPVNLNLLAGINVYKAFDTISTGDAVAAYTTISEAMAASAEYRRKVLDSEADSALAKAKTPYEKFDAHLINYRYSLAIEAIRKTAEDSDYRDNKAVARLVYAMLRQSRFVEVEKILTRNALIGQPDQYVTFLRCVVQDQNGDDQKSVTAYKKAVAEGTNWTSKTFDAYLTSSAASGRALKNYMRALSGLVNYDRTHPTTAYYELKWDWARNEFDLATGVLRAGLTREPAAYDLYVEQGCQQLGTLYNKKLAPEIKRRRVAQATASFRAALQAKPDAPEALNGYALVAAMGGDWALSIRMAEAARRSTTNYASGYFTLATLLESQPMGDLNNMAQRKVIQERHDEAVKALSTAVKMDRRFAGQAPKLEIAVINYLKFGRPPVIATPAEAYPDAK